MPIPVQDYYATSVPEIMSFIWSWFKWLISTLHHFYIFPSLHISLLAFIIAVTVIGLVIDALFVKFENAAEEGFDLPE